MNESFSHLADVGEVIGEYGKGFLQWYALSLLAAWGVGAAIGGLKKMEHKRTGVDEERDEYRRED